MKTNLISKAVVMLAVVMASVMNYGVAETDLLRPLCHAVRRENGFEDVVKFGMCVFSGKFVDHDSFILS